MKWKPTIFLFCVFTLGLLWLWHGGQISRWLNPPNQQDVIQKVFSSQQIYDVFADSTNVTAQLMHRRDTATTNGDTQFHPADELDGYALDPPVLLSPVQAQQVQHLLQAPSSYMFGRTAKACLPMYGVLFSFHSNQQTVRIALCFECNMLGVFSGEDINRESVNTEEDFDLIDDQLVAIVKAIFPSDPDMQKLEAHSKRRH